MIVIIIDKPTPLSLWDWRALNSGNKMILKGELQFKKWSKKSLKEKKKEKKFRLFTGFKQIPPWLGGH